MHLKLLSVRNSHDDVIKWKHFPRYWPFVRGIHRSPVNSPHKGQWRGTLLFSLICARINCRVNSREAGELRRNRAHYGVIVMLSVITILLKTTSSSFSKTMHSVYLHIMNRIMFQYRDCLSMHVDFHHKYKVVVRRFIFTMRSLYYYTAILLIEMACRM